MGTIFSPILLTLIYVTTIITMNLIIRTLRIDLIKEELEALTDAMNKKDLLEVRKIMGSNE